MIPLMLGGLPTKHLGEPLHARVRYFDPSEASRPARGRGALVESLSADGATLSLVNLNPSEWRTVVVQGGSYAGAFARLGGAGWKSSRLMRLASSSNSCPGAAPGSNSR